MKGSTGIIDGFLNAATIPEVDSVLPLLADGLAKTPNLERKMHYLLNKSTTFYLLSLKILKDSLGTIGFALLGSFCVQMPGLMIG